MSNLTDCNFIVRMLFCDSYWRYWLYSLFIFLYFIGACLFTLRSDSCSIKETFDLIWFWDETLVYLDKVCLETEMSRPRPHPSCLFNIFIANIITLTPLAIYILFMVAVIVTYWATVLSFHAHRKCFCYDINCSFWTIFKHQVTPYSFIAIVS